MNGYLLKTLNRFIVVKIKLGKRCNNWPRLQNQFGPDQILIGPRSGPNLVM